MIKQSFISLLIISAATLFGCSRSLVDNPESPLSLLRFDLYVTGITPYNYQIDVPLSTTIQATFSKDIDFATIFNKSFIVADSSYVPISGTYSYDSATRTVTFVPSALLTQVTEYNVLITTDVTDTNGNRMTDEAVWYFTTILTGVVPSPFFTPPAGVYVGTQNIVLDSIEPSSTIRYTLDGTVPTCSTGLIYTAPLTIAANTINPVQAIACRAGYADSSVVSSTYIIQVYPPHLNPMPGDYNTSQLITMSTSTSGATIKYTTDGTDPLTFGIDYTAPVLIGTTTAVRAIATDPLGSMANSTPISAVYTINSAQVAAPVFTPGPGSYSSTFSVTLTTSTPGAVIRYTTDGSTPTSSYGTIGNSVTIPDNTTLQAIAYDPLMVLTDSSVTTGVYIINPRITAVTPNKGPNTGPVTVTIKGKNFDAGATAALSSGGLTIAASSLTVVDSATITCTFDITGYAPGKWDMTVTNPDGGTSTNVKYFRIY